VVDKVDPQVTRFSQYVGSFFSLTTWFPSLPPYSVKNQSSVVLTIILCPVQLEFGKETFLSDPPFQGGMFFRLCFTLFSESGYTSKLCSPPLRDPFDSARHSWKSLGFCALPFFSKSELQWAILLFCAKQTSAPQLAHQGFLICPPRSCFSSLAEDEWTSPLPLFSFIFSRLDKLTLKQPSFLRTRRALRAPLFHCKRLTPFSFSQFQANRFWAPFLSFRGNCFFSCVREPASQWPGIMLSLTSIPKRFYEPLLESLGLRFSSLLFYHFSWDFCALQGVEFPRPPLINIPPSSPLLIKYFIFPS